MTVPSYTTRPMNTTEWALIAFLAAIWGGSFFFIAIAVKELPPFTIVFLRVFIGALGLLALLALTGQRIPMTREALIALFAMGLFNNVIPQTLIVFAQQTLPSGQASILNATTPFFTVLLLHFLTRDERATPLKWAGVAVGFTGVALMIGLDVLKTSGALLLPQLAMLTSSCSYGISGLTGRRVARLGAHPTAAAAGQLCASSIMMAPMMLVFDKPFSLPMPSHTVWLAILGLALISTALAYIVYFRILATAGPTNLSLVTFLVPVSALLLGILFLGETLHLRHLVGMVVIGLGLALIDGRPVRRFTERRAHG
ncbi:MAG: EamA family transporter [Proteobacteria bacterium]|nr:EamA family transporter [Pseudomonadota bacterium]